MSDDRDSVTRVIAKQAAPKPDLYPSLRCDHRMLLMVRREEAIARAVWLHCDKTNLEEERGLLYRQKLLEDHVRQLETEFIDAVAATLGWPTTLSVQP